MTKQRDIIRPLMTWLIEYFSVFTASRKRLYVIILYFKRNFELLVVFDRVLGIILECSREQNHERSFQITDKLSSTTYLKYNMHIFFVATQRYPHDMTTFLSYFCNISHEQNPFSPHKNQDTLCCSTSGKNDCHR